MQMSNEIVCLAVYFCRGIYNIQCSLLLLLLSHASLFASSSLPSTAHTTTTNIPSKWQSSFCDRWHRDNGHRVQLMSIGKYHCAAFCMAPPPLSWFGRCHHKQLMPSTIITQQIFRPPKMLLLIDKDLSIVWGYFFGPQFNCGAYFGCCWEGARRFACKRVPLNGDNGVIMHRSEFGKLSLFLNGDFPGQMRVRRKRENVVVASLENQSVETGIEDWGGGKSSSV